MKITSTIYNQGKQKVGTALVWSGQGVRRFFNRLTTYWLMKEYALGTKHGPFTLMGMLKKLTPFDFGSVKDTAFIAGRGCEQAVDEFLAGTGRLKTPVELKSFRNGESYARIGETVRNKTVVIFEDFEKCTNVNDKLMETLLIIDAAKRADAKKVILICPYLPYIDEPKGSCNYDIDYFKLVLNLLFKAASLDELRIGNLLINRQMSYLFLFDKVFSRNVAPFMIAHGEHLLSKKDQRSSEELIFLSGENYRAMAFNIIGQLRSKYEIKGEFIDLNFVHGAGRRIICSLDPRRNFSNKTVYIFQTCNTGKINDDLMEALFMAYTARKKGAKEIVMVMPYLPYNRQERKAKNREAIAAKLVANAFTEAAGVNQIITLDPHAPATQGFVDIPFQFITAFHLIVDCVKEMIRTGKLGKDFVSAAPDLGRAKMARKLGKEVLGADSRWAEVDKERPKPGEARVAAVIGQVTGRDVVLYDDMGDSATTTLNAVKALKARGANRIFVTMIHGVHSDVRIEFFDETGQKNEDAYKEYDNICKFLDAHGKKVKDYVVTDEKGFTVNALIRLQAHPDIAGIVFTDSLNVPEKNIIDSKRVRKISIVDLMATVCGRIIRGESLKDYQYEGT